MGPCECCNLHRDCRVGLTMQQCCCRICIESSRPSARLQSEGLNSSDISASDIGKRIWHHLEQADLYAGENNHGFRRGSMQALAAAGMASADIGQKVQINTAITVAKYLDFTRHETV